MENITLPKADYENLLEKSEEELMKQMNDGAPDSTKSKIIVALVSYKLQKKLVSKNTWLTLATWFLAIAAVVALFIGKNV